MLIRFVDRAGNPAEVEILSGYKEAGYRPVGTCADDLRGPLLKLWLDGHLGVRHCAITAGNAPLVQRGPCLYRKWQGHGVGAKVICKVAAPVAEEFGPARLWAGDAKLEDCAEIIGKFRPQN